LHIPAGYAQSILLHNICLQGDMQIFICFQAMPRAFPQHPAVYFCNSLLTCPTITQLPLTVE
ncbi:hypothetical protein T01_6173, partial [Trichinella spiralis]